jgi:hypothetical protein
LRLRPCWPAKAGIVRFHVECGKLAIKRRLDEDSGKDVAACICLKRLSFAHCIPFPPSAHHAPAMKQKESP